MDYMMLPLTSDPSQILYLPASPDGRAFQARLDLRWLPAPGHWFLSVSDAVSGDLYVNQIPLICSCESLNDLLYPFRWLFQGAGIGSLFCLKAVDTPSTPDPGRDNLSEFQLLWGDRYDCSAS